MSTELSSSSSSPTSTSSATSSAATDIVSTLAWGAIGATLVYFGRRNKASFLSDVAVTAGYGMITKAVSKVVVATLSPS